MNTVDVPIIIAILGFAALLILVVVLVSTRFKVAGPNQAFIITGRKGRTKPDEHGQTIADLSGQRVVLGGGAFIVPLVQKLHTIDLSARRISIHIEGAVSAHGIRLNLDGVAVVKVGSDADSIRAAAQRFLTQQDQIDVFTTEVLAGALRSIVGGLSVEEVIRDRAAFASRVSEESESALTSQGLTLDTFQIQDITSDSDYLQDLGRAEAARVQRDAAVAESVARQDSEQARLIAEERIAEAERNLALKVAAIRAETDAASAKASAAGPLEAAARQQDVLAAQALVAQAQAALTDKELDTQVRKPADAQRYRVEIEAEAARTAKISTAEADRQAAIAAAEAIARREELTGVGERAKRVALAEAAQREAEVAAKSVQLAGDAEAGAISARGLAEAAAMDKKAEAFKNYNEAAVLQMLVEMMPKMAHEVSSSMANIDNLTVLSTEGAGALPKTITSTLAQTTEMVKATTGIDMADFLNKKMSASPKDIGQS